MTENLSTDKVSFAKATQPFIQRAQFPSGDLLPIIPPGAKVHTSSSIDSSQIGKIPGRYNPRSQEWVGLTGAWPTMGLSQSFIAQASAWPTSNVGLRAENWPALDIDVASEEARDLAEMLANFHFGYGPVRIRAGAPRALIVFRRSGEEPIRKMRIVFKDGDGQEHAVELLGFGQQYLIAGTHPTGARYEWREGADLETWGAGSLTKITADDARNFFDALHAEIEARGWTVVRDVRLRPTAAGMGYAVKDLDPVVSTATALAALKTIPNTEDVLPMREDLVGVIAGFKAAVGRNADECLPQVREWAMSFDWADDEYVNGVWKSLSHVRVGPDRLFGLAHKFGFIGDAQEDFKDVANVDAKIVAAQAEADEDEQKLSMVGKRVVYWEEAAKWIDVETKVQLSVTAFNQSPNLGVKIAPSGATGVRTASNRLLNSSHVNVVHGMTYMPGQKQIMTWELNGRQTIFFNKWTEKEVPQFEPSDADIQPWLDHVAYLFDNVTDREYILDFLAHIVQRRGRKIRWAPIIIGNQGVGKDLFLRPIVRGLGERTNAQMIAPERIMGNFADFYEKELVIVEEITRGEKTDVYEHMKAIISGAVSDTVSIERKYEQAYDIPNVVNFVFFSNHADALNLSSDDRRFFVIHSYAEPQDSDYYEYLSQTFYEQQQGWQKVWWWLKRRDISKFNPDARPLFNEAKQQMIEDAAPFYCLWMRDTYLAGRSVVLVKDILTDLTSDFSSPARVRDTLRSQAQVAKALKFANWHVKQIRWSASGDRKQVWCRSKEVADSPAETIRSRYDAEIKKKSVNVA